MPRPTLALLALTLPCAPVIAQQPAGTPPDQRTVTVTARILDTDGKPVTNAAIAVFQRDQPRDTQACRTAPAARSDAEGRIRVQVTHPAKRTPILLLAAPRKASLALLVPPPKSSELDAKERTMQLGDVMLHQGASILGLVRDPDGKPIAGAEVVATDVRGRIFQNDRMGRAHQTACYGISDAQGRVRLSGISAYGVSIKADAPGCFAWSTKYHNRHTPLVVTLERNGEVRGVLLDPDGKPLQGGSVYAYSEAGHTKSEHETDADGRFVVRLPGRGRYRLYYSGKAQSGTRYGSEYSPVFDTPRADVVLRFGQGSLDQRGNRLAKKAAAPKKAAKARNATDKLELRVVDAKSGASLQEARGAVVWWQPQQWQYNSGYLEGRLAAAKPQKLDERGILRLSGPDPQEPGTGRALVSAKGYAPKLVPDITWQEDGKNVLSVSLQRESAIAGTVVDPKGGAPLAGVEVLAVTDLSTLRNYRPEPMRRRIEPAVAHATTDAAGNFRLGGLPSGKVHVFLSHPQRADTAPTTVTLADGEQKEQLKLTFPSGGSLAGKLTGTQIACGWTVRIQRLEEPRRNVFGATYGLSDNQRYESTRVADDGSFTFHGLTRANYLLSLVIPSAHGSVEVQMEPLRVRSGRLERTFDVSEDLPGRLEGRVTIHGAAFPPGRLVVVAQDRNTLNPYTWYSGRPNVTGEFSPLDARGRYSMPLAEGSYFLRVVDLSTGLTLLQETTALAIAATKAHNHDLKLEVVPVRVTLTAEGAGPPPPIDEIEIRADHPKPAQPRGVRINRPDHYTGVAQQIARGTKEVELLLPAVPCKLFARSEAHHLDPKTHSYNFPAQGEAELTPASGSADKVTIQVGKPKISFPDEEQDGEAEEKEKDAKDKMKEALKKKLEVLRVRQGKG
ncbi:MAG: carboxypeptidase regulatory-like domain-containing protein [Planctomycetes bacterium]|nr:carboxypeptidase regulatory-like domain-containing protein [Planctomycetota bacterium]